MFPVRYGLNSYIKLEVFKWLICLSIFAGKPNSTRTVYNVPLLTSLNLRSNSFQTIRKSDMDSLAFNPYSGRSRATEEAVLMLRSEDCMQVDD
jgi:hypothetical protein